MCICVYFYLLKCACLCMYMMCVLFVAKAPLTNHTMVVLIWLDVGNGIIS